jgi:hypothetical protein
LAPKIAGTVPSILRNLRPSPLHHLPIIGFIYRSITGDTISPASKVAGGALFGGVIGLAASVADTVLEEASGKNAANHIVALLEDTQGVDPSGAKEAPWSATALLRHDAHDYDGEFNEWRTGGTDIAAKGGDKSQAAQTVSLRHDAHDHDDEFNEWRADGTDIATKGGDKSQAAQTVSLRHDAHDHEDSVWDGPETAINTENVAAVPQPVSAGPGVSTPLAINPARNTTRPGQINGATAAGTHPVMSGSALKSGPRMLGTTLPQPQALAANPDMITALRKGGPLNLQPGGGINSNTWLKLMNNVSANRDGAGPSTGANGLTSATLAKALATYGAAEAAAPKANTGLIRP